MRVRVKQDLRDWIKGEELEAERINRLTISIGGISYATDNRMFDRFFVIIEVPPVSGATMEPDEISEVLCENCSDPFASACSQIAALAEANHGHIARIQQHQRIQKEIAKLASELTEWLNNPRCDAVCTDPANEILEKLTRLAGIETTTTK